jgi:transposase
VGVKTILPLLFERYSVAITFSELKNQWFYSKIKGCIFFLQIVAFNNTHIYIYAQHRKQTMSKPSISSLTTRKTLRDLLTTTKKRSNFQRIQCVYLRAEMNMKADMVAKITQLKPGTVRKIWSTYLREGITALFEKNRGGRRNYNLTKDEEMLFLEPFFKKAIQGAPLNVNEIKNTYEAHINKKVPKSTIYRMLARNGWKRKAGKSQFESPRETPKTNMHDYWIDGCAQVLHPERTGNISQQWLNQTLNSMSSRKQHASTTDD